MYESIYKNSYSDRDWNLYLINYLNVLSIKEFSLMDKGFKSINKQKNEGAYGKKYHLISENLESIN